ncbi:MAG: hypothetical protein HOI88_03270 [Phycisphaerae bacterium]|jgi:enediyne biosynthesis protein E4|nr:hypothetical protein [Phycisphaerae bacterium]MBT6282131.1 hypothetical protein [Phycisphaerae bacterium]
MKRQLVLLLLCGCSENETASRNLPTEVDQSSSTISFFEIATEIKPSVCGADSPTQIIEVNGTGIALLDFDNDNDLDVFVVSASNHPCRLYENISDDKISFVEVTDKLGIQIQRWGNGVAVGDVNGDGFDDLYITCHGSNVLLLNQHGESFKDETGKYGVGDTGWGTSARFGDLDGDGDLDLYVCNYVEFDFDNPPPRSIYKGIRVLGGPHGMLPMSDIVYENVENRTFKDVTNEWGFGKDPAYSLNVAILDFTGDGLQDVFVGNDSMSNNLFVNTGETPIRFKNKAIRFGAATNGDGAMQATMGIGVADVSGNGYPDIFTTNFSSDTNTLLTNDQDGYFNDQTKRYGLGLISRSFLGWTCGFYDFDLDGDEDLLIVNGHVYPEATMETMDSERAQTLLLLERVGNRFVPIEQKNAHTDRTAVFGDLDSDGDIDVLIAQRSGALRILRNDLIEKKTLSIQLKGNAENPKGLGAKITVTYSDGSTSTRWNTDGFGFQSSTSPSQHLFANQKGAIEVEVIWQNNVRQVVTELNEYEPVIITKP